MKKIIEGKYQVYLDDDVGADIGDESFFVLMKEFENKNIRIIIEEVPLFTKEQERTSKEGIRVLSTNMLDKFAEILNTNIEATTSEEARIFLLNQIMLEKKRRSNDLKFKKMIDEKPMFENG